MGLKVLRVIKSLPRGGIEKRLARILPLLQARGLEMEVACIREKGPVAAEIEAAGIPVHCVPARSRLDPLGLWRLYRLIKRRGFDVVHGHMYGSNVPATIAAHWAGTKAVVAQVHNAGTFKKPRRVRTERWLMRWRHAMVGVSGGVRDDIVRHVGSPERCRVIYNGIDTAEFENETRPREVLREALGFTGDEVLVVTAARLVPQKNHQGIVEAAARLVGAHPRARFLFAGRGGLAAPLEASIARLDLGGHVTLLGQVAHMPALLKACDVFLLPSFKEGFSNAILEAMAAGLPVVAGRVGGNPEAIVEGETGHLVEPDDTDRLVAVLGPLLADEALRRRMGRSGRERVVQFSLEAMVDQTVALYEELCGAAAPATR